MSEKTVKLQIEDKIIEFNIEENQELELNIQNINNELKISKSDSTYLDKPKYDLYDQDYIENNHETSIYDVLNNNIDAESKEDEIDSKDGNNNEDDSNVENDLITEASKENQSIGDANNLSTYQNMISDALERFNNNEQKENNA